MLLLPATQTLPARPGPLQAAPLCATRRGGVTQVAPGLSGAAVGLRQYTGAPAHVGSARPSHEQPPRLPWHQDLGVLGPWSRRQVSGRPVVPQLWRGDPVPCVSAASGPVGACLRDRARKQTAGQVLGVHWSCLGCGSRHGCWCGSQSVGRSCLSSTCERGLGSSVPLSHLEVGPVMKME